MKNVGHQITLGKSATIFHEGDRGDGAYIIERGTVEVSINRRGQKIVLGERKAGEIFGEMAIIDDGPRTATITTLEPCELIRITRDQIANRMVQADPILRMYLGVILERFRTTLKGLQAIDLHEPIAPVSDYFADHRVAELTYDCAMKEIKLEKELSNALRGGQFELQFQPIMDLQRRALVGFESLIRWRHRERGLILPGEFLPTAEASGLIVPIGKWVFRRSCQFLRHLNTRFPPRSGDERLFVSINVSARSFNDPNLVKDILAATREAGVSPSDIKIEITETTLFYQTEAVEKSMRMLKSEGFSIAIDDFGTGYSSLSYLHKYPFDTLKIDRSFVQNLHGNPKNDKIMASIAALASHLNLSVIAEGIETREQERQICELNCAYAQGYLYSRPVAEKDVMEIMKSYRADTGSRVAGIGTVRFECA